MFPVEEQVPETELHLELRVLLYHLLKDYLGASATVGSDQFIYYDASNPAQVLAPDVYVCTRPQEGRLLERQPQAGNAHPSLVLGLYWVLAPAERYPLALRIASSEAPESLIPTRLERADVETQARQVEARARQAETQARHTAEQERNAALERVRELEALLAKRES